MAICLPQIAIGKIRLRFIFYSKSRNKFLLSDCCEEDEVMLFLGADIVSMSSQSSNNHVHIHNRFWNKDLAIKVSFRDFPVEGICNSTSLWFYTLQGLFKLAFDYLSWTQQRDIVTNLWSYWLTNKDSMDKLPKTLDFSRDSVITPSVPTDFRPHNRHHRTLNISALTVQQIHAVSAASSSNCAENSDLMDFTTTGAAQVTDSQTTQNGPSSMTWKGTTAQSMENIPVLSSAPMDCRTLKTPDRTIAESMQNTLPGCQRIGLERQTTPLDKIFTIVCSTYQSIPEKAEKEKLEKALIITSEYFLTHRPLSAAHGLVCFPFDVLDEYNKLASLELQPNSNSGCNKEASSRQLMLCVVSSWLGREFFSLRSALADNVTRFKQRYILHMHDLPPPKSMVRELFPPCMVSLIQSWMGWGTRQNTDHCYAEICSGETKLYAFVLLILELINNTLISGVSHVLYAELVRLMG